MEFCTAPENPLPDKLSSLVAELDPAFRAVAPEAAVA